MKITASILCLLMASAILSGCASKQEEKEAYYQDGKMDQQVEAWKKPGGRY